METTTVSTSSECFLRPCRKTSLHTDKTKRGCFLTSTSFASGKKPHLFHDNEAEIRLPGYHIAQKARFAGQLCAYYSSRLANPVIIIVNTFSFSFGSR
jgi:hypothetical protein